MLFLKCCLKTYMFSIINQFYVKLNAFKYCNSGFFISLPKILTFIKIIKKCLSSVLPVF